MESKNPFNKGSKTYEVFEILSDLKWHSRCELVATGTNDPNRVLQDIKDLGWYKDNGMFGPRSMYCNKCKKNENFWRLASLQPTNPPRERGLKEAEKEAVKAYYGYIDAMDDKKYQGCVLEVDHKLPNIRRDSGSEEVDTTKADWMKEYQLLTRTHNLEKREACNNCFKTGIRPIGKYYLGDKHYDQSIGCKGCFYYDTQEWKKHMAKIKGDK